MSKKLGELQLEGLMVACKSPDFSLDNSEKKESFVCKYYITAIQLEDDIGGLVFIDKSGKIVI